MGSIIHAVRRKDGTFVYREYSNASGMYNTPTLNEKEISFYLLWRYAWESGAGTSLASSAIRIPERLSIAKKYGSSDGNNENRRSLKNWDRKPQDYWGKTFPKEKTKEAFLADVSSKLDTPFREIIKEEVSFGVKRLPFRKEEKRTIDSLVRLLKK